MAFGGLLSRSPILWARRLKTNTTMSADGGSGHLVPHKRRTHILQQLSRSLACNLSSKHICFWGWLVRVYGPQNTPKLKWCMITTIRSVLRAIDPLIPGEKHIRLLRGSCPINQTSQWGIWRWLERVYGPQNAPLLWWCIIAIIKLCFEGHRPSQPRRQTYPLAQGIIPYQSNMLAWDLGVVGEVLWPSKWRWPWWWWLAVVGHWLSVAWCLRQHKSTVRIVQI
jgi:hypothetical protein